MFTHSSLIHARRWLLAAIAGVAAVAPAAAGADVLSGRVPSPPTQVGCYSYTNATWVSTPCASAAYVQQHIPHPELLAGVGAKSTAPPFDLGTVSAQIMAGGSESDGTYGSGYYSVQDNVMFTGSNGDPDGVQFTDQTVGVLTTCASGRSTSRRRRTRRSASRCRGRRRS